METPLPPELLSNWPLIVGGLLTLISAVMIIKNGIKLLVWAFLLIVGAGLIGYGSDMKLAEPPSLQGYLQKVDVETIKKYVPFETLGELCDQLPQTPDQASR